MSEPQAVYLKDYRPPAYFIPKLRLTFDLFEEKTLVTARAQVRRNTGRFPPDFVFQLSAEEAAGLRSQIATSRTHGGRRYLPYAFTEHGAIMAATILNSRRAIEMSIYVVRGLCAIARGIGLQQGTCPAPR